MVQYSVMPNHTINKKLFVLSMKWLQLCQLENQWSDTSFFVFCFFGGSIEHRINSDVDDPIPFHLSVAERMIPGWIMGSKV